MLRTIRRSRRRNITKNRRLPQPQSALRETRRTGSESKGAKPEEAPKAEQGPNDHEKSVAILSKLKDMEFHSRANIETLAQLILTIEEELKQGEFSEAIGSVYSAQDAFHSKIAALIETYAAKCEELKGTA